MKFLMGYVFDNGIGRRFASGALGSSMVPLSERERKGVKYCLKC